MYSTTIGSMIRRYVGFVLFAVAAVLPARAEYTTGDTYIDLEARGQSSYNISVSATIAPGGQVQASAWASYASISGSSWGYYGEAGVALTFSNIRKVNGVWKAPYVTKQVLRADASGWDYYSYSEVTVPAAGWAQGSATCSQYSNPVAVQIN